MNKIRVKLQDRDYTDDELNGEWEFDPNMPAGEFIKELVRRAQDTRFELHGRQDAGKPVHYGCPVDFEGYDYLMYFQSGYD